MIIQVPKEDTWNARNFFPGSRREEESKKVERGRVDEKAVQEKMKSQKEQVEFENMFHIYKNVKREDL